MGAVVGLVSGNGDKGLWVREEKGMYEGHVGCGMWNGDVDVGRA